MKNCKRLIVLMIVLLPMAGHAWAGPNINPGLWEFTTETKMEGAGNMQVPSETHTQCITADDLVPMSQGASQECQISNVVTNGDTTSWEIVCSGQGGQMEGTGEVTYHGDTMEGSMVMVISSANMKLTNHITGRRIGNCSGSSTAASAPQPVAQTSSEPSAVGEAISEDAKDVGQAARDEVKDSTSQEVRKGVRGLFKNLFK
ncbi:DUF3617 domain-containing protein [Desulfosarcina ovata]|uniref:DUF3617 domain-containing protein n=1 Tax=Desulfosarcina ovata subsp. ovata TaxID=2752305 RepID=A0A5K8ADI8_9BACT|nr:DUF3617 family protein [Desulfosarcina ovata]BBO90685.1 hypothetical protein DSCOOX_38650 [Desulfosarcina ovata subsp. ovata]